MRPVKACSGRLHQVLATCSVVGGGVHTLLCSGRSFATRNDKTKIIVVGQEDYYLREQMRARPVTKTELQLQIPRRWTPPALAMPPSCVPRFAPEPAVLSVPANAVCFPLFLGRG